MRFLFLLLPLALGACADPTPPLPDSEFLAAYDAALASGDAEAAVAVVKAQAEAGDVGALGQMAAIYRDGYVRDLDTSGESKQATLVVWPWQEGLWRRRYIRERDRQAREGDADALFYAAQDLQKPWIHPTGDVTDPTHAELDSAHTILSRLAAGGHPLALFSLGADARMEGDPAADSLLAAAEAAGSFAACVWRASSMQGDALTSHGLADQIDRGESCRALTTRSSASIPSESVIRGLRAGMADGSPEARMHLDSLRALGVFERHPHLARI